MDGWVSEVHFTNEKPSLYAYISQTTRGGTRLIVYHQETKLLGEDLFESIERASLSTSSSFPLR